MDYVYELNAAISYSFDPQCYESMFSNSTHRASLRDLEKGIKGLVVMSSELEDVFVCVFEARVPAAWEKGDRQNYNLYYGS